MVRLWQYYSSGMLRCWTNILDLSASWTSSSTLRRLTTYWTSSSWEGRCRLADFIIFSVFWWVMMIRRPVRRLFWARLSRRTSFRKRRLWSWLSRILDWSDEIQICDFKTLVMHFLWVSVLVLIKPIRQMYQHLVQRHSCRAWASIFEAWGPWVKVGFANFVGGCFVTVGPTILRSWTHLYRRQCELVRWNVCWQTCKNLRPRYHCLRKYFQIVEG